MTTGVGRSGCFILIDAMLERIDSEGTVDILSYLNYMRTQRIYMVQTFDQYIFAHTAVLEYITFGNTETFLNELHKKFKQLTCGNGKDLVSFVKTPVSFRMTIACSSMEGACN